MLCGCIDDGDVPRPLVISSSPVGFLRDHPSQRKAGKLTFRGGLELTSPDRDFGGLSSLLVSADGSRFLAVSDQAHWISGRLGYTKGLLTSASGEGIAPMLDMHGEPMSGKTGDAEGVASAAAGDAIDADLFVSFEGKHRVWRYAWGTRGALAVPTALTIAPEIRQAPPNAGLEGITRIGEGMLLAVSEHFRNDAGNFRAWTLPYPAAAGTRPAETDPKPRELAVKPIAPFSLTDLRQLEGGDLLLLERRFDTVRGVGIELRRIPWASLHGHGDAAPETPLDGEVVGSLDAGYEIDNMEGLAVRRGEQGETLVYLVSDDNFNRPLQRTLLLMFALER